MPHRVTAISYGTAGCSVPVTALLPFVLITFGVAWGVIGLYVLLPEPMAALFSALSATRGVDR